MVCLKKVLEKLNLKLDIPKVQYEYPVTDYETYEFKTIDGEKCVVLKELNNGFPMICIINLNQKNVKSYLIHSDNDLQLISSMDKEGFIPIY